MSFELTAIAGAVRAIGVPATFADVTVLNGPGFLVGWSFRDTTDLGGFTAEGSVVAPVAGGTIVTAPGGVFGLYTISWTVSLGAGAAAADANNFGLYVGATLVATSVNLGAAGEYPQPQILYTVPGGQAVTIKAIGAGTAAVAYSGVISGIPGGGILSAFELYDGPNIIGEGAMPPGNVSSGHFGSLGIEITGGVRLHMIGGTIQGVVYCLYDKAE